MGSFVAVGKALTAIRDQELYREQFRNFKDYCADRWGIGRAHAARLITGSKVATNLLTSENFTNGAKMSPIGDIFNTLVKIQPTSEYQIRPLTILEPAQQCEVWEEAVRSADGKVVTYKQVKALVTELIGPGPEPNPPSPSHSGFAYSGPRGERLLPPCPTYLWVPPSVAVAAL
jgi:hypothetical protein